MITQHGTRDSASPKILTCRSWRRDLIVAVGVGPRKTALSSCAALNALAHCAATTDVAVAFRHERCFVRFDRPLASGRHEGSEFAAPERSSVKVLHIRE